MIYYGPIKELTTEDLFFCEINQANEFTEVNPSDHNLSVITNRLNEVIKLVNALLEDHVDREDVKDIARRVSDRL